MSDVIDINELERLVNNARADGDPDSEAGAEMDAWFDSNAYGLVREVRGMVATLASTELACGSCEYCTGVRRRRIEDARKLKSDAERFRAGEPFPASATASTGRDPARKEIVPGLWSVMVPGIVRGSAARIQLTTSDGTRAVDPFVTVEVCAVDGVSRTVELSLTEARALLAVAIEWPGLKREGR